MNYFSMFSGIGGFELGIEKAVRVLVGKRERDTGSAIRQKAIDDAGVDLSQDNGGNDGTEHGSRSTCADKGGQEDGCKDNLVQQIKQEGRTRKDTDYTPSEEGEYSEQPERTVRKSTAVCVGYSEIDRYALQKYREHFPNHKEYGNATEIDWRTIPDIDLLVGGFPCQAFSIAGKRRGFGDVRGILFFEIAKCLGRKQPRLFLLENVKGLLSHDEGRTYATILSKMDELGYEFEWQVLNSKHFGVPQNRERVFIVGHLRGTRRPEVFPFGEDGGEPTDSPSNISGAVQASRQGGRGGCSELSDEQISQDGSDGLVYKGAVITEKDKKFLEDGNDLSRNFPQAQRIYDAGGIATTLASQAGGLGGKTGLYAIPVLTPDRTEKRQNGRRFKEDGDPSFTLTAQDKHGVFDGARIRRLTPTECERLQGFDDGWTEGLSDTQRYKCLGNAVTVNVVQAIMERLLKGEV